MSAGNRIIYSVNNNIKSKSKSNALLKPPQPIKQPLLQLATTQQPKDLQDVTTPITATARYKRLYMDNKTKKNMKYVDKISSKSHTLDRLTSKIKNNMVKLYKDLYDNYILIVFLDSKNKTDFLSKIKLLSLKIDNYKLSKTELRSYKLLYSELMKRVKRKCKHINTRKLKTASSILKLGGSQTSGPYLQRLISKGDQPITGDDMAKTLEEIITILSDLRYLDDAKEAYGPTVLINYFMGNTDDLKSYLRYKLLPNFVQTNTFPPKIEFKKLYDRWDNIVDLLNLYKNDKKIKTEWAVSQGLKSQDALKDNFIDKLAGTIDAADQKFQKYKALRRGDALRLV